MSFGLNNQVGKTTEELGGKFSEEYNRSCIDVALGVEYVDTYLFTFFVLFLSLSLSLFLSHS